MVGGMPGGEKQGHALVDSLPPMRCGRKCRALWDASVCRQVEHRDVLIRDKVKKYGNGLLLTAALPVYAEFPALWSSPRNRFILLHSPLLPSCYRDFVPRRNSLHALPLTKGRFRMRIRRCLCEPSGVWPLRACVRVHMCLRVCRERWGAYLKSGFMVLQPRGTCRVRLQYSYTGGFTFLLEKS